KVFIMSIRFFLLISCCVNFVLISPMSQGYRHSVSANSSPIATTEVSDSEDNDKENITSALTMPEKSYSQLMLLLEPIEQALTNLDRLVKLNSETNVSRVSYDFYKNKANKLLKNFYNLIIL